MFDVEKLKVFINEILPPLIKGGSATAEDSTIFTMVELNNRVEQVNVELVRHGNFSANEVFAVREAFNRLSEELKGTEVHFMSVLLKRAKHMNFNNVISMSIFF